METVRKLNGSAMTRKVTTMHNKNTKNTQSNTHLKSAKSKLIKIQMILKYSLYILQY